MASLDDHLCDSLPTKCLATHEFLLLQSGQCIARPRQSQYNGRGNQAARIHYDAEPLSQRHGSVNTSSRVIGGKSADESIKPRRGRADSEKKRYLDEYEDEGRTTAKRVGTERDHPTGVRRTAV